MEAEESFEDKWQDMLCASTEFVMGTDDLDSEASSSDDYEFI
jgi:hypothetical protein